jgi:hypothetical protein
MRAKALQSQLSHEVFHGWPHDVSHVVANECSATIADVASEGGKYRSTLRGGAKASNSGIGAEIKNLFSAAATKILGRSDQPKPSAVEDNDEISALEKELAALEAESESEATAAAAAAAAATSSTTTAKDATAAKAASILILDDAAEEKMMLLQLENEINALENAAAAPSSTAIAKDSTTSTATTSATTSTAAMSASESMTESETKKWLLQHGLGAFVDQLAKEHADGMALLDITEVDDLEDFDVPQRLKKKFLRKIDAELRGSAA